MKNLKLSLKIGFGFASLIIIALCLGSVAVWKMTGVKADTTTLAVDFMPAVVAANNVEREALITMYQMRGYAFTEDEKFLKAGRQNLAEVKKHLRAAKELAGKSNNNSLEFLKQAAEKAEGKTLEYEQLADQTVAVTEALHKDRAAMDEAAQQYMNVCATYLGYQEKLLREHLGIENSADAASTNKTASPNVASILDRTRKISIANEIVNLGNAIRIGNFKSQALRDPKFFQETQNKFEDVNKKLDELKAITKQDVNLRQIEACRVAGNAYNAAMTSFLKNWQAREALGVKRGAVVDAVLAEAKNTAISSTDTSGKMTNTAAGALGAASTTMVVGLTIAVIVGVLMAVFITRSITRPIKAVATTLSAGADQTASAAGQVSSASQSLAEGASEQAASLEETSSSLEEMSSMIKKNSENAQKAQTFANQARVAGDAGTADMKEMSAAIGAIKASSDDIAMIIETIHEIAFQTNILALNAAVEAARAGEAGMGFAVVADEVRNLAQRCAQAAKEITGKIKDAVTKSQNGVNISAKVAKGLDEIVTQARQVDELISEVATASKEQAQGITQVNTAVSQMDKVTQSNAASAEESASAAEELNAQAEALQEAVSQLMQLVDGNAAASARHARSTAPKASSKTKAKAVTVKANKNGDSSHGHDGENTPAHREPELVAAGGNRGGDIPMDGDFKRF